MARPLNKKRKNGVLYVRNKSIDEEIDKVIGLDLCELNERLSITETENGKHLRSETLVHLVRNARRDGDKAVVDAVFKVLIIRCEANLRKFVSNSLPNAQHIREEVLCELGKLIARDGTGKIPDRLDLFEWRFNLQFKSLRLDAIRREMRAVNRNVSVSDDSTPVEIADLEAAFEKVANSQTSSDSNAVYAPSPEDQLMARDIYKEINNLPKDERNALVAVKILGLTEAAAGKKLGVSDRTIRTRKKNAIARLENLKEST